MTTPDCLHHYTSLRSLEGILRSQSLWASSIAYLNDAAEYKYAAQLALDLVPSLAEKAVDELERATLLQFPKIFTSDKPAPIYVFCLSRDSDQLSQWRAYGSGVNGVAIGFSVANLGKAAAQHSFALLECIYDRDAQQALLVPAWELALTGFRARRSAMETASQGRQHGPHVLARQLWQFYRDSFESVLPRLKHPAFAEEQEWRLVSPRVPRPHPQLDVHLSGTTHVPHYVIPLPADYASAAIHEITIGPSSHPALVRYGVEQLILTTKTQWRGVIHFSKAPLQVI